MLLSRLVRGVAVPALSCLQGQQVRHGQSSLLSLDSHVFA